MTEKRFDWDMNGIFDYENDDEDYISEYEDLSDLLNEQDDENKSLKKDIKILGNHNTEYVRSIYILENKIKELKEENEQLKSTNMEREDYLGRLEEENSNLQIKLQKIRDYAQEDGEVKQEIIENIVLGEKKTKNMTNNLHDEFNEWDCPYFKEI